MATLGTGGATSIPAIPDWQKCIVCYVKARDGKIVHTRTCPDYPLNFREGVARPAPGSASGRRAAPTMSAYENVTSRLKQVRHSRYQCPSCGDWKQGVDVRLGQNGKVLIWCYACCPVGGTDAKRDILTAIGLTFKDLSTTLRLIHEHGYGPSALRHAAPGEGR